MGPRSANSVTQRILTHFKNVKAQASGWTALCPAHEDQKNSLSLSVGADGKFLMHCFGGCNVQEITRAAGLELKDLFPEKSPSKNECSRVVAEYVYRDAIGTPALKVIRLEPKDFRQQRWDGNSWSWSGAKPKLLYHLSEVLQAGTVFIVEGEKDADNLKEIGLTATTVPGGANNWQAKYVDYFSEKQCVNIIPDNDSPGTKHAETIASALYGHG